MELDTCLGKSLEQARAQRVACNRFQHAHGIYWLADLTSIILVMTIPSEEAGFERDLTCRHNLIFTNPSEDQRIPIQRGERFKRVRSI
jgi:hypothetical protein